MTPFCLIDGENSEYRFSPLSNQINMSNEFKTLKIPFVLFVVFCIYCSCSKDKGVPVQVGSWDVIDISERSLNGVIVSLDTFYYKFFFDKNSTGIKRYQDGREDKILEWHIDSKENEILYLVESILPSGNVIQYNNGYSILTSEKDHQEWST